jgi:hypothetical protein
LETKTKNGVMRILSALLLICGITGTFASFSQGNTYGKVVDGNGKAIPYVSIGFVGTTIGTVSDLAGNYSLNWAEAHDTTTSLKFSCMGFVTQEMTIKSLPKSASLNITMQDAAIELSEVLIRPIEIKKIVDGNDNESTAVRTNLAISSKPNMNLGAEIGRKFRLKNKPHFVNKLKVFISANNFDTVTFRINFYQLSGSKPDLPIQQKSIIREVSNHKKGWVTFDLTSEYLVLSGTSVASVEWIGTSKKGNYLAFNLTMPALGQTHYYKYGAQNDWKVFRNMSTSMILEADMGYN